MGQKSHGRKRVLGSQSRCGTCKLVDKEWLGEWLNRAEKAAALKMSGSRDLVGKDGPKAQPGIDHGGSTSKGPYVNAVPRFCLICVFMSDLANSSWGSQDCLECDYDGLPMGLRPFH